MYNMRTNHCMSNGCTSHVEPILAKHGKPNSPPTQCLDIALISIERRLSPGLYQD